MPAQFIEIEADSLEEARQQVQLKIPAGWEILSEQIIADGTPETVQAQADTSQAAFEKAEKEVPEQAIILTNMELAASQRNIFELEARDEQSATTLAQLEAKVGFGSAVEVRWIRLVKTGSRGLLGVRKTTDQYEAELFQPALVEITFTTRVRLRLEIGNPVAKLLGLIEHGNNDQQQKAIHELASCAEREEAIPVLMKRFHETGPDPLVMDGLVAVGTPAALRALLEIFWAAEPNEIHEDDTQFDTDKSEAGAPAAALLKIPDAIVSLRSLCSDDEFERILVRAHQHTGGADPELNQALGEIASPIAISRKIGVLWNDTWTAEMRLPAKEALVKIGQAATRPTA